MPVNFRTLDSNLTMNNETKPTLQKEFLETHKLQAPIGPVFKYPDSQAKEMAQEAGNASRVLEVAPPVEAELPVLNLPTSEAPVNRKRSGATRALSAVTLLASGAFTFVYFGVSEKKETVAVTVTAQALPSVSPPEITVTSAEVSAVLADIPLAVSTPSSPTPADNSIEVLFGKQDYAAVAQVARLKPCTTKELNMAGIALYALKQFTEAANTFKQVETMLPNDAIVKSNLGDALLANGQTAEALEKYREAHRISPTDDSYKKRITQLEQQLAPRPVAKVAQRVSKADPEDFSPRRIAPILAEAYTFVDLRNAVERSDIAQVDLILAQGFDINNRDSSGQSLLIVAINNGDLNMTRHLILKGADPNLPGHDGYLPLVRAKAVNPPNLELIRYLKTAGAQEQYTARR